MNDLYYPDFLPLPNIGNLYLGGYYIEENPNLLNQLKTLNIGIIFSLGFKISPFANLNTQNFVFDIEDMKYIECQYEMENIIQFILPILDKKLKEGKNIYIHCEAGISRSPTIVVAYLMEYFYYSLEEAISYIKLFRPQIYPNCGFKSLLQIIEQINYLRRRYKN